MGESAVLAIMPSSSLVSRRPSSKQNKGMTKMWGYRLLLFTTVLGSWVILWVMFFESRPSGSQDIWLVARSGPGRLGNQIFQYASVWGMYNDLVQSQKEDDGTGLLVRYHLCVHPRHPFQLLHRSFPSWSIAEPCPIDLMDGTLELTERGYGIHTDFDFESKCRGRLFSPTTCVVSPGPYLQSFKYVQNIREQLSTALQAGSDREMEAKKLVDTVRGKVQQESVVVVGVHVRRRDVMFVTYLQAAPASFLAKAEAYYEQKYDRVEFLVVTDDVTWCKENLPPKMRSHLDTITSSSTSRDAVEEFAVLRHCDHFILTVGTFGWWAAYASDHAGEVVYYRDAVVKEDPTNQGQILLEDYYPRHWIGMSGWDVSQA